MKKLMCFLLSLAITTAIIICGSDFNVHAAATVYEEPKQGLVIYQDVRVRTGPSTSYSQLTISGKKQYYTYYQILSVLAEDKDKNGDQWYQVKVELSGQEYTTWIYGEYLEIITTQSDSEYEAYLIEQGFDEVYRGYLRQLHALHPNWVFTAYKTGLEWDTVVAKESKLGKSLVDGSDITLRSVAEGAYNPETGKFIPLDGSCWYAANTETVAYYLDPRNFMNSINIFMFLQLSFNEDDNAAVVQKLMNGTFMSGKDEQGNQFADLFYQAASEANVNTVYLAALCLQEQGTTGSKAITGAAFTYNDVTYSGLYNYFNIGATSGTDNWKKGLIYANGGATEDGTPGTATSNGRPWTSSSKAIAGGAKFISNGYINAGQDTMYLQKFNVTSKSTYSHQYMTNVRAAYSQSKTIYSTFKETNRMDGVLHFSIPVFNNMSEKTSLPDSIELPKPEEPGLEYTGDFIKDLNLSVNDGFIRGFALATTYGEIKSQFTKLSDQLTVSLTNSDGIELSDSDVVTTGQIMTVTDASGVNTYTYVVSGDVNGDGKISLADLLWIKKCILSDYELTGPFKAAALINGETSISLKSYLFMKKYILGQGEIDQ